MSRVTVIPAKLDRATFIPLDKPIKRRVAGYARVSTDSEEQLTSYEAQVSYYTDYIRKCADWEFVNVYTDEGISATNTQHRHNVKARSVKACGIYAAVHPRKCDASAGRGFL